MTIKHLHHDIHLKCEFAAFRRGSEVREVVLRNGDTGANHQGIAEPAIGRLPVP